MHTGAGTLDCAGLLEQFDTYGAGDSIGLPAGRSSGLPVVPGKNDPDFAGHFL